MPDTPEDYSRAVASLREAFKDEPEKLAAVLLALGVLVDRVRDLERQLSDAKDEAARAPFFARTPASSSGPFRG